jgi:hypothetical protein
MARDTQPRTLSGIPRVEGVAPETPQQDIRNALTIIQANFEMSGNDGLHLTHDDVTAVMLRLQLAITKLERQP